MQFDLPSQYNPQLIENKWFDHWLKKGYFNSKPDSRKPYCIVIPPPNVTGVLHMGHILNNTLQDVLIRRARMQNKNACWVPGTDHASIATEAKIVAKLKSENIDKKNLTRDQFLKHAWDWTHKHGSIILEQLKKLGASCDWSRTAFTMDEIRYNAVIDVFIDLYEKKLIYRGNRMVNWDPQALTALSDEEVIYKETQGKLYYVKYFLTDDVSTYVTIATTRPETILADTAVCVNPKDVRYKHLHGKQVFVPLVNRAVPIIVDDYVDMDFGTGCLKITPAHDHNDYLIGQKHNLQIIDILNDNGTLNENAQICVGLDRFEARKIIIQMLEQNGLLEKIEDYIHNIGYSERTDVPVEPKLSTQWFLKMEKLAKPALEVVMNDTIRFHPKKFKNLYRRWMENIKDWCISRQLWWGHRIPAWYLPDGRYVVAKTAQQALEKAKKEFQLPNLTLNDLKQDEDVLDTWFSSWLWPIAVFDGINNPNNAEMKYYYPTEVLVTAPEILFFWVARMIMAGLEYAKDIPFKNVYFTGIVRDKFGRKMSKSLGNSPEPLELIANYGADGVRIGMLMMSQAGNDLLFDESLCVQGRNFLNKVWNALRLIKSWTPNEIIEQPEINAIANQWFKHKLNQTIATVENHMQNYRISDALIYLYRVIWDEFCSWYLEIIKPDLNTREIDAETFNLCISYFETLMKLLHPFAPFITEEIWHKFSCRKDNEDIIIATYPSAAEFDENEIENFDLIKELVSSIRNSKNRYSISQKTPLLLFVPDDLPHNLSKILVITEKLCNISSIMPISEKPDKFLDFLVYKWRFGLSIDITIGIQEEIEKIQKQIDYYKDFIENIKSKLNNTSFISNAPAKVIEKEKRKELDALEKISLLQQQLSELQKKL